MMKISLNVRQKILVYILSSVALVLIISNIFIGINSRNQVYKTTTALADSYAGKYANLTQANLNSYMDVARSLTRMFENYEVIPEESRRDILGSTLRHSLEQNPDYLSVWSILLPETIDGRDSLYINQVGSNILGSFRYLYYRDMGQIFLSDYVEQDPEKVSSGYIFNLAKEKKRELILDPSWYSYRADGTNAVLQTNVVLPVTKNGRFMGILGIDVPLAELQRMTDTYRPVEGGFAFLLTSNGTLVSFPVDTLVGKKFEATGFSFQGSEINNLLQTRKAFSFNARYVNGQRYYLTFAEVPVGNTGTPWFVGFAFPHSVIRADSSHVFRIAIFAGILGLMLISFIIWKVAGRVTKPLQHLTVAIDSISRGKADDSLKQRKISDDEIGSMSKALNTFIDGYISKAVFAEKIGAGDLDSELAGQDEQDRLANSLLVMRNSLKMARKEEEERKKEDQKRNWISEGLNKFADLLTQNNDNIEKLSFSIIRNLVHYLNANQGGIFIKDRDDELGEVFDLVASYAYNRKKYLQRRIIGGEGLVGTCAMEKKSIYLTKIPQGYINITSGLGDANPDTLLIVPMKKEEEVLGVIELASFNKLESYQIEFVEKIAENMALTIQTVKVNVRTAALLEKSQQQAEEMRAQEEEMRQNMEELEATQEAMAEKERETRLRIDELTDLLEKKDAEIKELRRTQEE